MQGRSDASLGVGDKPPAPTIFDKIDASIHKIKRAPNMSSLDMEILASEFLILCAEIAAIKREYDDRFVNSESAEKAFYAHSFQSSPSKVSVTEKKIFAESDASVQDASRRSQELKNKSAYLKTMHEIFFNAHIFYRQVCKEG